MKRVHLIISGDVQGVGYRAWALRYIENKAITGWVKNRRDRTVELVAEGSEEALKELITACHKGPELVPRSGILLRRTLVKNVAAEWLNATEEFVAFKVIY